MKREKSLKKRWIALIIVLALFAAILAVTPTLARYIRGTSDLGNEFESKGSKNPTFEVNGEETEEKPEKIVFNVGKTGYPVYVRVKVLVTWKSIKADATGNKNVLYVKPVNKAEADAKNPEEYDYDVTYNTSNWLSYSDGYFYYVGGKYNGVVASGSATSELITKFVYKNTKPPFEGYQLNVEFIVQTVQAVGYTDDDSKSAMEDAWGIPRDALSPKTDSDNG